MSDGGGCEWETVRVRDGRLESVSVTLGVRVQWDWATRETCGGSCGCLWTCCGVSRLGRLDLVVYYHHEVFVSACRSDYHETWSETCCVF